MLAYTVLILLLLLMLLLQTMDTDCDGVISIEEFMERCRTVQKTFFV